MAGLSEAQVSRLVSASLSKTVAIVSDPAYEGPIFSRQELGYPLRGAGQVEATEVAIRVSETGRRLTADLLPSPLCFFSITVPSFWCLLLLNHADLAVSPVRPRPLQQGARTEQGPSYSYQYFTLTGASAQELIRHLWRALARSRGKEVECTTLSSHPSQWILSRTRSSNL